MNTTAFCELVHTTRDTLRYYDSIGLLKPRRSENGYRDYTSADSTTYNIIQNLKAAGLSLNEISQVLQLQNQPITSDCRQSVLTMIQEKNDYFTAQYHFYAQLMAIASQMSTEVQNNHQEKLDGLIEKLGYLDD
ncbi:transcriptional regulator [Lentilactobacillus fungorum]|uniref:Transcriptional regulator n=1 Tax=Lentilactobacillus fungorum TaxID=2201250 RepID=A0ABQ3VWY1_9LACO|nr:MerR family transcriptional regulator [Lentilactobacillus fungorum]GHP13417.1 transcriptional regulator [Lentilactobacillus fungorum]